VSGKSIVVPRRVFGAEDLRTDDVSEGEGHEHEREGGRLLTLSGWDTLLRRDQARVQGGHTDVTRDEGPEEVAGDDAAVCEVWRHSIS